jgi:hypothetical protein
MEARGGRMGRGEGVEWPLLGWVDGRSESESAECGESERRLRLDDGLTEKDCSNGFGSRSKFWRAVGDWLMTWAKDDDDDSDVAFIVSRI